MAVYRVTAEWSGIPGAPGYSVFHFSAIEASRTLANSAGGAISGMFQQFIGVLPAAVSVRVSNNVELLNEADGELQDSYTIDTQPNVTGTESGGYSAVSGAVIHWTTSDTRNGRRVRGRNFIVPLSMSAYESNGTLTAGALGTIQNAAQGVLTATPVLQVWARPTSRGAADGAAYIVTGARVPDKAAVLRSRRD